MVTSLKRSFYGWTVVAAAFVVAVFGWGVGFYGPPVYLNAVQQARGWSLPLISGAVTVHFLLGALVVANLPALHARFGLPAVTKAGAISLALGVLGWATASAPWQLYAATILSGAGWVALGAAAINAIISPWFIRSRPAALAMAYNGASIGGVLFSPLWVAAIAWLGFAGAAALIGCVMVAALWLLADLVISRTPEAMGLSPDGDAAGETASASRNAVAAVQGSIWRNRSFLTLAIGMSLGLFAQIGLIAHLFSLLVPPLGAGLAGVTMGMATACAIAGRTLMGFLLPGIADRRLAAAGSYGVQILGCAAFLLAAGHDTVFLIIGVVLFGVGIGNATSLPPLIAQMEFAKQDVQRAVALITATSQATYAFAPAVFGAIRAFSQANEVGTQTVVPLFFCTAALFQLLAIASLVIGRRQWRVANGKWRVVSSE
ncbi:Cyanate permease [Rhizobiales bacterium GAS188]|nr:Cyanate permease [Rhizobiales bacterium GAS188]